MSGLLGSQLPMFAVAALVVVVALIAAVFVVRRSRKGARGEGSTRGRQAPRLAMIDSTPIIDGRKLVIVRRDDVEHLVLIGGATDVLIEANIRHSESVDAVPAQSRESAPRIIPAEVAPRVAATAAPTVASEAKEEIPVTEGARLAPEAAVPPRSPVAEPPAIEPVSARLSPAEPVRPVLDEPAPSLAAEPAKEQAASAPTDHFAELAAALQRPTTAEAKAPSARPAAAAPGNDDQNLTDMAHRLEAALRRPISASGPGFASMRSEPRRPFSTASQRLNPTADLPRVPPRIAGEPRLAPEPRLVPEPRVSTEPKTDASEDKPAFESLEREMASLLGRSPR